MLANCSGARRNAAQLNLKISADVGLYVISGDLASNRGWLLRLITSWTHFTHFYTVFTSNHSVSLRSRLEPAIEV